MIGQMVGAVIHVCFSHGDSIMKDQLCAVSDMCFRPGHCYTEDEFSAVKDVRFGYGHSLVIVWSFSWNINPMLCLRCRASRQVEAQGGEGEQLGPPHVLAIPSPEGISHPLVDLHLHCWPAGHLLLHGR